MPEIIEGDIYRAIAINKSISMPIVNESDMKATRIEIYDINKEDNVVTCRLYDGDRLVTGKRVYELDKLPCKDITKTEMEILFPPPVILE